MAEGILKNSADGLRNTRNSCWFSPPPRVSQHGGRAATKKTNRERNAQGQYLPPSFPEECVWPKNILAQGGWLQAMRLNRHPSGIFWSVRLYRPIKTKKSGSTSRLDSLSSARGLWSRSADDGILEYAQNTFVVDRHMSAALCRRSVCGNCRTARRLSLLALQRRRAGLSLSNHHWQNIGIGRCVVLIECCAMARTGASGTFI